MGLKNAQQEMLRIQIGGGESGGVMVEKTPRKGLKQWWNLANFWVHTATAVPVSTHREYAADKSLKEEFAVLSVDIGHLPLLWQYLICAGGVMVFLLLYGYLQELVIMNKFKRSLGWFVTLLQFSGYTFYAWLQRAYSSKQHRPKVPLWFYIALSVMQAFMQGMTNLSMHYLNYPAKVLFKSSRLVVTMLFGALVMGKRYSTIDYWCVLFMVAGLVAFIHADLKTAPSFEITGVILISFALAADAAILNVQEYCMQAFNACHDEMIYFSYLGASLIVFVLSAVTGEISEGVEFLRMTGSLVTVLQFLVFCGTGFLGVSCSSALTKRFGALVCAITTTARKAGTLLLSFVLFNNPGSFQHGMGAVCFIIGLLIKAFASQHKHSGVKQQHTVMETPTKHSHVPRSFNTHTQAHGYLHALKFHKSMSTGEFHILHDPRTGESMAV